MARPRQYSQEFRERAIRMVAEADGGSMRRIASQLGISYETIRKWVHQAEVDGGLCAGTMSEQLEELRRLLKKERGAASRQRDPEVGISFFRTRARPTSAEMIAYIDSTEGARFGVEPICRTLD